MTRLNNSGMKKIALFLLAVFLQSILSPTIIYAISDGPCASHAIGFEPVGSTGHMVDKRTGDFIYNMTLLDVPGPTGNFPINLFYHAGIKTNQGASDVGLGWGLPPLCISRTTVGYPDDYFKEMVGSTYKVQHTGSVNGIGDTKSSHYLEIVDYTKGSGLPMKSNFYITPAKNSSLRQYRDNSFDNGFRSAYVRTFMDKYTDVVPYGSLYLGAFQREATAGVDADMDMATDINFGSEKRVIGVNHIGWDNYQVNVNGIFGNIEPHRFDNGSLVGINTDDIVHYSKTIDFENPTEDVENFVKNSPCQFRYTDEIAAGMQMEPGAMYLNTKLGYNDMNDIDKDYSGLTMDDCLKCNYYSDSECNSGNGHCKDGYFKGKRFVEWFTEAEIYAALQGTDDSKKKRVPVNTILNNLDAAVAKVEDANGKDTKKIYAFKITAEDGTTYHFGLPVFAKNEKQTFYAKNPDGSVNTSSYITKDYASAYAYAWMLTAITGPDFVDRGTIGQIDDDDYGYWIKFDYGKWCDAFPWRSPYNDDTYEDDITFNTKMISQGEKQLFYLNKISTRTHAALFFHEERLDGYSAPNSSQNKFTQLRTKEIRLLKNTDVATLETQHGFKTLDDINAIYMASDINAEVAPRSIKTARFVFSYDLCKGIPNSQNPGSPTLGKLTLKEVIMLGKDDTQITPSTKFDYDESDANSNPDYAQEAWDRWGYYKSDAGATPSDRYVTLASKDYVSAWSLKKITTPMGGIIEIEYESDSYSAVGKNLNVGCYGTIDLASNSILLDDNNIMSFLTTGAKVKMAGKTAPISPCTCAVREFETELTISNITTTSGNRLFFSEDIADELSLDPPASGCSCGEEIDGKCYISVNTYDGTLESSTNPGCYGTVDAAQNSMTVSTYNIITSLIPGTEVRLSGKTKNLDTYGHCINKGKDFELKLTVTSVNGNVLTFAEDISDKLALDPAQSNCYAGEDIDGACYLSPISTIYGGGIRVKQIKEIDEQNNAYIKEYDYSKAGNNLSSGFTALEPPAFDQLRPAFEINNEECYEVAGTQQAVIGMGPGVYYAGVVEKAKGINGEYLDGGIEYAFIDYANCFGQEFFDNSALPNASYFYFDRTYDYLDFVGLLKSVSAYNNRGQLVSEQEYLYGSRGLVSTVTQTIKDRYEKPLPTSGYYVSRWKFAINERARFKPALAGIIEKTPDSKSGVFYEYDGQTGLLKNVIGNGKRKSTQFAHTISAYADMGSKADDIGYKNMLIQPAGTYVEKYNTETNKYDKVIDAAIQTWNNTWQYRTFVEAPEGGEYVTTSPITDVWRKHKTFVWSGKVNNDGTYEWVLNGESFDKDFDWAKPDLDDNSEEGWLLTTEVKGYDHFSFPVEVAKVDGTSNAAKTTNDMTTSGASCSNAKYTEFAYSGAEDEPDVNNYFGGEVKCPDGVVSTNMNYVHTGNRSVQAGALKTAFLFTISESFDNTKKYGAGVWVHENDISYAQLILTLSDGSSTDVVTITQNANTIKAGDWYLLQGESGTLAGATSLTVKVINAAESGATIYCDDFRVFPSKSGMATKVYDPKTGWLIAEHNNDNLGVKYHYDAEGRLIKTEKEMADKPGKTGGFVKVSEKAYHFGRSIK